MFEILKNKSSKESDIQVLSSTSVDSSDNSIEYARYGDGYDIEITSGAPVENKNPLGYSVGPLSVIVLVLQGVVGTGIFSTPGSILKSMGSIGSTYVLWILCFFFPLTTIFVYIEYASYFPKRNGGDVAYLEKAYPKPKFLIPTVYAAISVILSYTTTSALAFGKYILSTTSDSGNVWHYRGIAIGALTFSCICIGTSTKWSLRLQNLLGFVKVVFLIFLIILGWVVLGGHTNVADPHQNFHNVWEGTTSDGNAIANAIIKVSFSYGGTTYAFGVVAEHARSEADSEEQAEKKLLKTYAVYVPISLVTLFVVYILIITGYYASSPVEELKNSGNTIATTMFKNVFGNKAATQALAAMVALSSLGHLITAVLSHSRSLRECGRQGVLPFTTFWTSTKPFGTPLGPILVTWLVNFIMIVAPPAGSAYNFIVDMGSYSSYIFSLFVVIGLIKIRRERKLKGLNSKGQYLPLPILIILILFDLMVIAIAFVPPKGTLIGSDVTFFYATYPIVTLSILAVCVGYYFIWRYTLPKIGKYVHREIIYRLENGELGNKIIKVKLSELEEWDLEHQTDENGVSRKVEVIQQTVVNQVEK